MGSLILRGECKVDVFQMRTFHKFFGKTSHQVIGYRHLSHVQPSCTENQKNNEKIIKRLKKQ